ncbi:MAG: hypothetical protein KJ563_02955, partial [Candidatus Thermoplasmatota archaeon]|nr:hypothetical protein [Candidatus Thermoplasmatota archaeon]
CQSLLDLCREGEVYTLAQYLEVAGDIEQRYFDEHYSEIEQLPDKRLDALWGIARAVEWKAGEKQISPELACVNPRDIRQFLEMKSSDLQHQIDTLKEPGSEYVYQAARATYGLLRPLLWKRLLRLKGEKAALEAFDYKPMKEMGPENFDDPTKARMWLKEFIAEGTRHSQSIWAYDEYWRESCVKDFLEAADRRADIFLVTRFEEQKLEGRKIRQALQALRYAREGRILLKNYEGPSNVVPIKGRLILIGESIGIHSSQSFAEVGKRECIVNRMSQAQIRNYLEALRKLLPDMEEFKPSASGGHP